MKRMTTTEAASLLGVSGETVRQFAKIGYLTAHTNSGETGVGKRFYFDAAEVAAFAEGGAPAAKTYRETKANPTPAGKGRGKRREEVQSA